MPAVSLQEKLRACLGALLGLGLVAAVGWGSEAFLDGIAMLIPPLGASAVLLFALPASPLAQPWSILGGNTVAAVIGVTAARHLPDPAIAAPVAAALAIGAMFALRCLHPPSGAIALTAVLGGPKVAAAGYGFVIWPVGISSVALLLAAIVFNRASGRQYPHHGQAARPTTDPAPMARLGIRMEDLAAVLKERDELIDVDSEDLERLFREAEFRAAARRTAVTAAAIMSQDLVTLAPDTPLKDAWAAFTNHRHGAIPVASNGVFLGLLSEADLVRHTDRDPRRGPPVSARQRLARLVRLQPRPGTVVADVMDRHAPTVTEDATLADLLPPLTDGGHHHLPVLGPGGTLVGIISQSDVIAALVVVEYTAERSARPLGRSA